MEKAGLVDNYLGMPGVTGKEMMERFRAHAAAQGAVLKAQRAGNVMPMGGTFLVGAGSDMYTSRAVILACGVSKAGYAPGEAEYLGRGVSYCATCDGMLYRQKRVAVWGLSPEAPEEAEFLHSIGCRVTYIAAKRPQALAQGIAFVSGAVTAVYGGAAVTAVDVKGEMLADRRPVYPAPAAALPDALVPGIGMENGRVEQTPPCAPASPGCMPRATCWARRFRWQRLWARALLQGFAPQRTFRIWKGRQTHETAGLYLLGRIFYGHCAADGAAFKG